MNAPRRVRAAYLSAAMAVVLLPAVAGVLHVTSLSSSGAGDGATAPATSAAGLTHESTLEVEGLDDFSRLSDQIAIVTVDRVERGAVSDFGSHVVQEHVVVARVETPIKGVAQGQELAFADGLYLETTSDGAEALGADDLHLVTDAGVFARGQRALVGLVDGEIVTQAILPIEDGVIAETPGTSFADDTGLRGEGVPDAVAEVRAAAT